MIDSEVNDQPFIQPRTSKGQIRNTVHPGYPGVCIHEFPPVVNWTQDYSGQMYSDILSKGLEHPWILVGVGCHGTNPHGHLGTTVLWTRDANQSSFKGCKPQCWLTFMPAQSVLIGWYQILTEIKQQSHQSEPSSISLQNMLLKPDGRHQNQIDYILCSQRWRSSIQSAKTRQGTDCGSDHELLIAKFRLKLKKVEKTTRPFSSVQVSSVAQLCPTLCETIQVWTKSNPLGLYSGSEK